MGSKYFNGNSSVDFTGGPFVPDGPASLKCWIKTGVRSQGVIACGRDGTNEFIAIRISSGAFLAEARRSNSTTDFATTGVCFLSNQWIFVCAVFTSSTSRTIYANVKGQWYTGSNTTSISTASGNQIFTRAGKPAGGSFGSNYKGLMARPAVYGSALSFSNIKRIYQHDLSDFLNPFLEWQFDSPSRTKEYDISQNGRHGTVLGAIPNVEDPYDYLNNFTAHRARLRRWSTGTPPPSTGRFQRTYDMFGNMRALTGGFRG